jgi:hypothetical protein
MRGEEEPLSRGSVPIADHNVLYDTQCAHQFPATEQFRLVGFEPL